MPLIVVKTEKQKKKEARENTPAASGLQEIRFKKNPELKQMNELNNKRMVRKSKRTKYHVQRKDKRPEDYQKIKLVIDGKEKKLSDSGKYLLDMMVKSDSSTNPDEVNLVVEGQEKTLVEVSEYLLDMIIKEK